MDMQPWLANAGFAIAILVFMWNINKESNKKTAILFRRFDEYKTQIEDKLKKEFVQDVMCSLRHSHSTEDFIRLERKVDEGFRNIDEKITSLMRNHE